MATFWPSTNPASFRPCANAVARSSELAAVVLRRNPITGTADFCARAASGHATTALLKSLVNSRRLMASPAPRTKSGIKRLSHFWIEICAVRRTQAAATMSALGQHRSTSNQCPLYPQKRTLELSHVMSALCQKQTSSYFGSTSFDEAWLTPKFVGNKTVKPDELARSDPRWTIARRSD